MAVFPLLKVMKDTSREEIQNDLRKIYNYPLEKVPLGLQLALWASYYASNVDGIPQFFQNLLVMLNAGTQKGIEQTLTIISENEELKAQIARLEELVISENINLAQDDDSEEYQALTG